MKYHFTISKFNLFGNIYAGLMLALCALPLFWMFQFFWLVPNLLPYFVVTWTVPGLGLGVGLYGLWITRDEKSTSKHDH